MPSIQVVATSMETTIPVHFGTKFRDLDRPRCLRDGFGFVFLILFLLFYFCLSIFSISI